MGLRWCAVFVLFALSFAAGQAGKKAVLVVACTDQKSAYSAAETVNLSVTIENRSGSTFYLFRPLEWDWTGLWFHLLDISGKPVPLRQPVIAPLPPPPIADKSQLVGLEPGYFYGRQIQLALKDYDLRRGTYFIAFKYQSNYHNGDGFGLPILTWDDGEIVANRIKIAVR